MGPQQIITTTTTRQTRLAGSISIARPVWWLAGDFFHQVDESFQAAQRKRLEKQSSRTLRTLLRSRSLSTSPKAVLMSTTAIFYSDKLVRGELGEEQLTPT